MHWLRMASDGYASDGSRFPAGSVRRGDAALARLRARVLRLREDRVDANAGADGARR